MVRYVVGSCWQSVRYKSWGAAHVSDMKSISVWYQTLVVLHDATEFFLLFYQVTEVTARRRDSSSSSSLHSSEITAFPASPHDLAKLSNDRPTHAHTLNISVFVLQTRVTWSWEKRAPRPVWSFQAKMMSAINVLMLHWATVLLLDTQGRPHGLWFKTKTKNKTSLRGTNVSKHEARHDGYSLCNVVPSAVCLKVWRLQKNLGMQIWFCFLHPDVYLFIVGKDCKKLHFPLGALWIHHAPDIEAQTGVGTFWRPRINK